MRAVNPSARPIRLIRAAWSDASLLAKGLRVVALPVLALVLTSSLVLVADQHRERAHDQREAAEAIDSAAGQVRAISAQAGQAAAAGRLDAATLARVMAYRVRWEQAVDGVERAALAEPDPTMQRDVRELRASTEDLLTTTVAAFGPARDAATAAANGRRASDANTRFVNALAEISTRARDRAQTYADDYDAHSRTMSRLILVSAALAAAAGVVAMVGFTVSIRRRVKVLEANSEALGAGRELAPFGDSADELGRLGRGLDAAAAVLRDREHALHLAAETLRQSEQRLSLAIAAGEMGTWDVDLTTGACVWDERSEEQHGLAPGTFGGTFDDWLALVDPADRVDVMANGADAIAVGGRWVSAYRTAAADGSERWIGTCGQSILNADGVPVRLVGVGSDITERKIGELRLRDAIAAAEKANHAKNEFLSRVSHELRTPLNAILGFGQLLEMDDLDGNQRESVAQVLAGGRHLLGLIDDVLDISRIESGNLPLSLEATALEDVVAETVALVSGTATDLGITVEVAGGAWSATHVRADRRRLKQILVNLASNAVKYNRPGGRVAFTLSSPTAGVVRVGVRDTGAGIPPERLDRLFTPFDRLGAEQTTVEGTGIGLALSERLAEMMGATLSVESEVGIGSTFSVDLAAAPDPSVAAGVGAPVEPAGPADPDVSHGTVLYVEDNPSNLRLVQRILDRRGGVRLLSAGTGAIALSLVERIHVDVVLLDLHLPDMNGAEVLRRLREQPRTERTPVVVVSADATPGHVERLLAAGADGFLTKPFDVERFLATIDDHLAEVVA